MNKGVVGKFIEKTYALPLLDLLIVLPFLILPLLVKLPFRVNIFLTWDGAYRMAIGQLPFVDYGQPLGYGFWLIPTLFVKLFGPTFLSLIKSQVVINLISLLALRGILYNLKVKPLVVTFALLIFCLTYVIYNFWPWYNHIVVVYEMVSIYFLTSFQKSKTTIRAYANLIAAAFFCFITLFTKQDVGGICFLFSGAVLLYGAIMDWTLKPLLIYILAFGITAIVVVAPFVHHDFFYWFNYGQSPHSSRISLALLLDVLLANSILEKVYLVIILTAVIIRITSFKDLITDRPMVMILAICLLMILQSLVTRVSSPLPTDHMTYFHTFAFVGIAIFLPWDQWTNDLRYLIPITFCLVLVYSTGVWKYVASRITFRGAETTEQTSASLPWVEGILPTLKHVLVPPGTNRGLDEIMALPFARQKNLKVLNMSELTFLAYEMGYTPQTNQPLWYHLNVGMFQKQVDEINSRIKSGYYDLVLYQKIASLPTFYPASIGDELRRDYFFYDNFIAPRKLEDSSVDIFINPSLASRYSLKPVGDPTN